jgi:hypothetical protein
VGELDHRQRRVTRWARPGSAVLATLALLALAAVPIASAEAPGLEFVAPEELAFTGSDEATVWLQNDSGIAVEPSFTMSAEDSDGEAVPKDSVTVVTDEGEPLDPYNVGRYRLHLGGSAIEGDLSGELVATAGAAALGAGKQGVAPASLSVSAGPKSDFDHGVGEILYVPAIAAFLLVLFSWLVTIAGGRVSLLAPLPALDFDFKTSFASTLTTVGALLATIIAAGVLPEETVNLSKESFTALNLLFAVAVVAAGLVYSALQTSRWVPKEGEEDNEVRKAQGHFAGLLLASLITVWAVFGELWTMGLLVDELGQDQGFGGGAVDVFKGLLIASVIAMCIYTPVRTRATVKGERPKPTDKVKKPSPVAAEPSDTPPAVAQAESVSLL